MKSGKRKTEVIRELEDKLRELEEALCQVNGKLSDIEDACEQEIIQSEEAVETVTDGSEEVLTVVRVRRADSKSCKGG